MKKLGMVLGAAALAVVSGCKDPDYNGTVIKPDETAMPLPVDRSVSGNPDVLEPVTSADEVLPIEVVEINTKHCTCKPGTKHTSPCTCGAPDCMCIVVAKPLVTPVASAAETSTYIVQRGDTLSKISKKYNIKIDAIKKLNGLKGDNIRLGQKLKLPGKVDVGAQTVPEGAVAKPVKKVYAPYSGETKEYVVVSGDNLGTIAYSRGINIRQLKELNGLTCDKIIVGQKLKVPAVAVTTPAVKKAVPATPAKTDVKKDEAPAAAAPVVSEPKADESAEEVAEPAPVETPAAKPAADDVATTTYVVQEGDDMTSVSILYGVTAAVIRELNNLGDGEQLKPGQVIKLPAEQ